MIVSDPQQDARGVSDVKAGELKLDGPVFNLPGGPVRAAIGAGRREESYELDTNFGVNIERISQRINSVFGELNLPVVGAANAAPGLQRLDLSVAGRYEDYSTFGSSFDPRVGLVWEPLHGLRLRGTYGTSFVAPKLADNDTTQNSGAAYFDLDPAAPLGFSYQLVMLGTDVESLAPQESESFTVGLQIEPLFVEGLRLSLDYYHIDYRDQVTTPPSSASVILGNPTAFGSLFVRNPTVAQVTDIVSSLAPGRFLAFDASFDFDPNFDPANVEVILDTRRRNLAQVRSEGIDASVQYEFDVGRSLFSVGINGIRALKRLQKVTSTAPSFETIGTLFNPPKFRARANATWKLGHWSSSVFVNYIGSYQDNRTAAPERVGTFTAVDASVMYRFDDDGRALSGVTLSLGAQNLFDQEPPALSIVNPAAFELGIDTTNASPLGRLITAGITKRW